MEEPSVYHQPRAVGALSFGGLALLTGGAVLLLVIGSRLRTDAPGWVVAGILGGVLTALLALGLLRGLLQLWHPPAVLTLTAAGYRASAIPDVGTRAARWSEVARVEACTQATQQVVVLHLTDRAPTRLPVRMLAEPVAALLADLDRRLDHAHGQRRLGT
ncbi:MAG: hypothetical protein ACR2KL_13660 [Nocardioidaceae bacterium]